MKNHESAFNTDLPLPVITRADFTHQIRPEVISIVDTDLGKCSVLFCRFRNKKSNGQIGIVLVRFSM